MTFKEDVKECVENLRKHKTQYVILHFIDIQGNFRGRTISATEIENALSNGVGFDGSSIYGFASIEKSDMVMQPDPATLAMLPHYIYNHNVATTICKIKWPNGSPHTGDSRYMLQKYAQKLQEKGYTPTAAAELEFYLVKTHDGIVEPVENHIKENPRYFDILPGRDLTEQYRMDLCDALSEMGLKVERQQHEVGSAQNEITFKYAGPVATADNILKHKYVSKAIAHKKYGWTATYMPKPWIGKAGNGMHVHLSLFSKNKNLFYDEDGYAKTSQMCRYFTGGLLTHAEALAAIVAPTVNSYKRLLPGYEAPVYLAWSRSNRSALVRIPEDFQSKENEVRIEFRCPDPLCNPYLAYLVLFKAGMDGVKRKIDPGDPVEANTYHLTEAERKKLGIEKLPASLKEALETWESDDICMQALGKENAQTYAELKLREWKEYENHMSEETAEITPWEIEKYLFA
ncbi:MAG: type I glutamate--ammonia ligase [Candidatus Bathyarchaeota archaeon]|nr:type I glutamate--ammonia ligase [Candidatus Bathyarchaeota archaeon]MDH5494569.1 type I glutamate--ammonia ligase [Candidatus Bathyarchaeota archaeon]